MMFSGTRCPVCGDGHAGDDEIHGDAGVDTIAGGTGDDVIHCGAGASIIVPPKTVMR